MSGYVAMPGEFICNLLRPCSFRGKFRILNPLIAGRGERIVRVCGQTMRLDLSEHIQRMMFLGCLELKETRLLRRWLRPGMTIFDVGANVGYYTALTASLVGPRGRVVAIEPSAAYEKLAEWVRNNQLAYVSPFRIGLSDRAGYLPIYLGDESNYTPTMVAHGGLTPFDTVPVCTLDDLAERVGIDHIDFLKIDVEGHEPAVFRGAKQLLNRGAIRAILCEFNEHWLRASGSSSAELWQMLVEAGFRDPSDMRPPSQPLENRFLIARTA